MACRTASVERVADKTSKAKEQIEKLEAAIKAQAETHKAQFYEQIDTHLKSAQIDDAREISYEANMKTEYTSQFSLDKIAGVVTSALKALQVATDPTKPQAQTSPEAIEAYTDMVNTVAEAAKSSSTAAGSLSFSMNRLAPGIIAFLYASSTNIQDDETFGNEAVTSTAVYYRVVKSIKDLELEGAFDAAKIRVAINLDSYKKMLTLQAALVDQLADGKIDMDTYDIKDKAFSEKIKVILARIKGDDKNAAAAIQAGNFNVLQQPALMAGGMDDGSLNHRIALEAVNKLTAMGNHYTAVVQRTLDRLAEGYF